MSALHEAARLVVAAWAGLRPTRPSWIDDVWIEDVNAAVLALGEALKAEPAQGPVAAAFSAAFGAEQHPADQHIVIARRGETLYLNGQKIGPGTLEIRRDGVTYRAAERVAVQTKPVGSLADLQAMLQAEVDRLIAAEQPDPAQEPVAYIHRQGNHWEVSERHLDEDEKARGWTEEPLYIAPPQRPPLTDEEIAAEWRKASECAVKSEGAVTTSQFVQIFARAVERKVRGE